MTTYTDRENIEYCQGVAADVEEAWESGELSEWLDQALEVEVISTLDWTYRGAHVYVTLGGPSVYVDTECGSVILTHSGGYADWDIYGRAVDGLDELIEEIFNCR